MMSIVVIFTLVWTAIDLLAWYKFIESSPAISRLPHPFYRYKIAPIVGVIYLAMDVSVNVLNYQAWGHLKAYMQTSEDALLQKGLQTFYSAISLTIIWFILSIINSTYRLFFL